MALDEKLELEMSRLARINSLVNGYEHLNYDEKNIVIKNFPRIAARSEQDLPALETELEKDEDVVRYGFMKDILADNIQKLKPDYDASFDEIFKAVATKLDEDLSDGEKVENPLEAIGKIAYAFAGLIDRKNPTQQEANSYRAQELSQIYGAKFRHVEVEDPSGYRSHHLNLQTRLLVEEFLKEVKDEEGKVTGYVIDKDKLKETMKNPTIGSLLYSAKKPEEKEGGSS